MAIDKALEEIKGRNPEIKEQVVVPTVQNLNFMNKYIMEGYKLLKSWQNTLNFPDLNPDLQKYFMYAAIDNNFNLRFLDVPKSEIIKLEKNEKIRTLMENTDLGDVIPDQFSLELNHPSVYEFFKDSTIFSDRKQLVNLSGRFKNLIIIPNLEILSLFMDTGVQFRDYLSINNVKEEFYFKIPANEPCSCNTQALNFIVNVDNLYRFYDQTKTKDLKAMIGELQDYNNSFNTVVNSINTGSFLTAAVNIRIKLYKNLQKNNPEMVMGE